MKKLLSLLATTSLIATTSSTVVSCGEKNVDLNKQLIEVTQGDTGEISIVSTNDLTGVKITGQVENQVTATVQDKKIIITVSETAAIKNYTLKISGDKIENKYFLVKVKEKPALDLMVIEKPDVSLSAEFVEITQGEIGEISITAPDDLGNVIINDQVNNEVTATIQDKKIIITVSKTAEVKDYYLRIVGDSIKNKYFLVKVKEKSKLSSRFKSLKVD